MAGAEENEVIPNGSSNPELALKVSLKFKRLPSRRSLSPAKLREGVRKMLAIKLGKVVQVSFPRKCKLGVELISCRTGGVMIKKVNRSTKLPQEEMIKNKDQLRKGMKLKIINGDSVEYSSLKRILDKISNC